MCAMKLEIGKIIFILVLVLSWISMDCHADPVADERPDKKEIIALYLFNFLLFVDWPEDASSDRNTITLIIHGDLRLYEVMKSLEGKTIKGKKTGRLFANGGQRHKGFLSRFVHRLFTKGVPTGTPSKS